MLCILCYLGYSSLYISRINLSIASPGLMAFYGFSPSQLGILGSIFFCVYACGRLFNGNLSDRIAPYVLLSGGLLLTGFANICSSLFLSFGFMIGLWTLNAYGQSVLWGAVLRTVSAVYSGEKRDRMSSFLATAVASGNVVGILLNVWLIANFGVVYAFLVPGALNVLCAVLLFVFTKNVPFQTVERKGVFREVIASMGDRRVIPMLFPAVSMGVMKDSITFWMAVFFTQTYAIELKGSLLFLLVVPFVGLVGRCIYYPVFRLCKQDEHRVSRFAFLICLVFSALLCVVTQPILLVAPCDSMGCHYSRVLCTPLCFSVLYFAVSVMNTSFLTIYPLRFSDEGKSGTVSGIMDFMNYAGAGIASLVYGFLIERLGFIAMFISWCIVSLLSFIILKRYGKKMKKS